MRELIHKAMASFMAVVVLMTTMSFTIDMHYCGDTMVDFSFFQNVATCGMENTALVSSCSTPEMSKKSCCSDAQLMIAGQDNFNDAFTSVTLEQQIFVCSFIYSYSSLFKGTESKKVPSIDISPPFLKRDVQVLHQTFLI
ncbi:MAG: hypothetical protein ACI849_000500 [Patiriisocius sp.]|jgi:hypothetical protein